MKRIILIVLLLISGIGIIAYPFIGNYLNQKNATQVMDNYQKAADKLTPEQIAELFQHAQIYNENLLGQPAHDPFMLGSGIVMPDNYYRVLTADLSRDKGSGLTKSGGAFGRFGLTDWRRGHAHGADFPYWFDPSEIIYGFD